MAAGSIVVDLIARTGGFVTDTARAERALKKLERQVTDTARSFGIGFAAAGTGMAVFLKSSIDAADQANELAEKIGISTEAISELGYAAKLSGSNQEELANGLIKLSSKIQDAADGNKAAVKLFADLGVNVTDASGRARSADAVFKDLADSFQKLPEGVARTSRAVDLFGKTGASLVPTLSQGSAGLRDMASELAALGGVIDGRTAKAAAEFNDNLDRLKTVASAAGIAIANELLPWLNDMAEQFLTGIKNANGLINAILTFGTINPFRSQSENIKAYRKDIEEFASAPFFVSNKSIEALIKDRQQKIAYLEALQQQALDRLPNQSDAEARRLGIPIVPPASGRGPGAGGDKGKASKQSEADRYLEGLRTQLQATKDLSVEEKLLADIQAGRLGKVNEATTKSLRMLAAQIDEVRNSEAQLKLDRDTQLETERQLADIYEQTRTPIEKLNEELTRLARLRTVSGANQDSLARAEFDAWERYEQQIKKTGKELDSFTKTAAENFQSFLGDSLADAMEGNFKDIERRFTQMINRLVAEAVAADISRKLFGKLVEGGSGEGLLVQAMKGIGEYFKGSGSGGSSEGSGFGAFLSQAASTVGSWFGGGKAGGGDVMAGREYWVGEQGPERFIPRTAGAILPAQASGNSRSLTVQNSFTVSGMVDRRTQMQIAADAGRSVAMADARIN